MLAIIHSSSVRHRGFGALLSQREKSAAGSGKDNLRALTLLSPQHHTRIYEKIALITDLATPASFWSVSVSSLSVF
jgi:hypothetical protein